MRICSEMQDTEYELHFLHARRDLLTETAELINREWPRSLSAREASIEEGCDELPCSLVLVQCASGRVVGHARLMWVAGRGDAMLVETVLVTPALRGRGLGRRLMQAAELHALKLGCRWAHLSTHDKQQFYSHLGYSSGPLVSALRKCIAQLSSEQMESLVAGLPGATEDAATPSTPLLTNCPLPPPPPPSDPPTNPPPPPPPPPPPLPPTLSQSTPHDVVTWMKKELF